MMILRKITTMAVFSGALAAYGGEVDTCLTEKLKAVSADTTVGELRTACGLPLLQTESVSTAEQDVESAGPSVSRAKQRLIRERDTQWSPYVLTAYKQNYILPWTYADEQNPIYTTSGDDELAEQKEAKFQLSVKIPLAENSLLVEGDSLHMGFTLKSFWQVYNDELSSPFRETNYQPEIFYTMPLRFRPEGTDTALRLGLEHESNGRTQLLSRSWNRLYAQLFYAKDNYLISFRPWYRLPEDDKDSALDPDGDDNPDIDDYMGYFELNGVLAWNELEISTLLRNNLRDENYGAVELGVSFPLWKRVRGYAQYFNGYGESLIDYNHRIERFGVGFLITDLM